MSKVILGVLLEQRKETATKFQDLLTDYGCYINTRIGMHQTSDDFCSEQGLIILEFMNDKGKEANELKEKISELKGAVVKSMEF